MTEKLLVIEDDNFLGDMLKQKLTAAGYTVSVIEDGKAGLAAITSEKPDLVLLDIMLPNMNGYEILEAKSKDPVIASIPVIIISNSGQPVEISRAIALGVRDYFVKAQVDPEEILQKVREQLAKPQPGTIADKHILLVEDDKFLTELLTMKLAQEKSEVLHAASGEEALELADKQAVDIILLDIVLPGMNGFDVLAELRKRDKTKQTPIVVLSNLGQQEDNDRALTLGANKFLIKAMLTPDQIVAEIKTQLASTPAA